MPVETYANLCSTTVLSGGTTAPSSGTTETWQVNSSAGFIASSSATPPTQLHIVDTAPGYGSEIVECTNISGTTWLVVRGAEGTTPISHVPGFGIQQVVTAGGLAQAARVDWLNAVTMFGADPTGTNNSAPAIQNALNAALPGQIVWLPTGTYLCTAELTIPPLVTLFGPANYRIGASGAILKASGLTSGALVTFAAGTPAGAIMNVTLDGSSLATGTVDGIGIYVNSKQGSVMGVCTRYFTNHGINITQNGGNPDGWYLKEISSHNNSQNGVNWDYAVDGQFIAFHLDNNGNAGLALGTCNNFTASHGKCQQNTNYGVTGTGGFAKSNATLSHVMTENSGKDGWHIDFSIGSGQGKLQLIGCSSRDEGTSGTEGSGYSAFWINAKYCDLIMVGCTNYITSSTAGQDYGLSLFDCLGNVEISASAFIGAVTPYNDLGGNLSVSWDCTTLEVGQDGSTVARYGPFSYSPGPAFGVPKPSDFGATAQTYAYETSTTGTTGYAPAAGVLALAALPIPKPYTGSITLVFETAVTGATATAGENFVAIYSKAGGAPVASAEIDSVVTATAGPQSVTLTLSTPLLPGVYWVGFLFNATTVPTLRRAPVLNTTMLNYSASASSARAGTYGTAQTALPSITPTSVGLAGNLIYVLAK